MDALFNIPDDFPATDIQEDLETPSIHEMFVYYDSLYFGGMLGACTVEWSPQRMTKCAGICYPQPGGGCILRLSEPLLRLRPSWDLKNTLIHEMIHAWLITQRISEGNGGHGPRFQAKAQEINLSKAADYLRPNRGYEITVFHTMHDEVRFYQQHHWKCNVCNKLICRAMNRKPQQADCRQYGRFRGADCQDGYCGYHQHLKRCPKGEFIKIKEPQGFSEKNKKRADKPAGTVEASKRPRNHPDSTRSITEFFKGPKNLLGGNSTVSANQGTEKEEVSQESMRSLLANAAAARADAEAQVTCSISQIAVSPEGEPQATALPEQPGKAISSRGKRQLVQRDLKNFLGGTQSPQKNLQKDSEDLSKEQPSSDHNDRSFRIPSSREGNSCQSTDDLGTARVDGKDAEIHGGDRLGRLPGPGDSQASKAANGRDLDSQEGFRPEIGAANGTSTNCDEDLGNSIERREAGNQGRVGREEVPKDLETAPISAPREGAFVARTSCPVCNKMLLAISNADLNSHIDACLSRSSDDDVVVLE